MTLHTFSRPFTLIGRSHSMLYKKSLSFRHVEHSFNSIGLRRTMLTWNGMERSFATSNWNKTRLSLLASGSLTLLFLQYTLLGDHTAFSKEASQPEPKIADDAQQAQPIKKASNALKLFCGNSNRKLANEIAQHLKCDIGNAVVSKFEDGEVNVMVHENVRGKVSLVVFFINLLINY